MTIVEMLGQSGVLTVLGMGIVFSFLVIMVVCVTVMGKIIRALGLGQEADQSAAAVQAKPNAAVTAAISAAITEYQKTK